MKAYLIDANARNIRPVNVVDGLTGIRRLIGYDSVDSEEIDASGDRLFFDEGCFLRDQTGKGRFKLDNLVPIADKALIVGAQDEGQVLKDAEAALTDIERRVVWL